MRKLIFFGCKNVIKEASTNATYAIRKLEKISSNVPRRHNVLIPGKATSAERSKALLKRAILETKEVSIYCGIAVCSYICKFCRYYNRTGEKRRVGRYGAR